MHNTLKAAPDAQALIFDLDGTLLDSLGLHWRAWREAFREQGAEIDHDLFITYTGKPIQEIARILIEHYNLSVDYHQILAAKERLVYQHLSEIEEVEAVAQVARDNYGRVPMAIGTGSDRKRAEMMLRNAGMLHMFDAIVCAEDVVDHKPAPDTFVRCAELMGVDPTKCQVFEDGEPGLQAARTAGMIATDVRPYYSEKQKYNI